MLEIDLWDVVVTWMTNDTLTWINAKLHAAEKLGLMPWLTWQAFIMALKAQFESLPKEERAREQIQKLMQIGNVKNYIYHFRELHNDIPSMNLVEAYNLFMHSLNSQLRQLARTIVSSGNLEDVMKVVKRATIFGEEKSGG